MLGIALHPSYPAKPFVYVYATRMSGGSLKNQILRLTNRHGTGRDRRQIFSTAASSNPYHNGGRIEFGPDGQLYAIVGEGHDAKNAQDLSNPRGKILRMTPQGDRPADNPIAHSKIFVYGIRNSFGFDFDPVTGELWETENGPECNDELNHIPVGGKNYGWGPRENCGGLTAPHDTNNSGPAAPRPARALVHHHDRHHGHDLLRRVRPDRLRGRRLLRRHQQRADNRRVPLDAGRDTVAGIGSVVFDTGNVASVETGPDGGIYFSDFSGIYRLVN